MTWPTGRAGFYRLRKNPFGLSFRGAAGDEESRIVLKTLRARLLVEFILSGQSEILRFAQNDSEGIGMTAWKGFSAACLAPPQSGSQPYVLLAPRAARRGELRAARDRETIGSVGDGGVKTPPFERHECPVPWPVEAPGSANPADRCTRWRPGACYGADGTR